jgi:hypothetical protein
VQSLRCKRDICGVALGRLDDALVFGGVAAGVGFVERDPDALVGADGERQCLEDDCAVALALSGPVAMDTQCGERQGMGGAVGKLEAAGGGIGRIPAVPQIVAGACQEALDFLLRSRLAFQRTDFLKILQFFRGRVHR